MLEHVRPQVTTQYDAYALHVDNQGCTRTRMCTHTHTHAHTYLGNHTHTHTDKYAILIAFLRQQWFAKAPQCYVVRTLPVLLTLYVYMFFALSSDKKKTDIRLHVEERLCLRQLLIFYILHAFVDMYN